MNEPADAISERCRLVLDAIDARNAGDPTRIDYRGESLAKEPLHARLMSQWLERLDPAPDELQRLAARGHHVQRWTRPRDAYPKGRRGYLRWRADAKRFHAEVVTSLMAAAGYGHQERDRVGSVIRKEGLGRDPWVQVHEDALCLVFLDTQLDATTASLGAEEMVRILERTIPKMSADGLAAAAELDLGAEGRELLTRAAAGAASSPSANTLDPPSSPTRGADRSD